MGNIATSVDKQIEILKQRGLIILDDNKAKENLLDIGYYRIGFYWHHFYNKKEECFFENHNLKEVVELYYFDFKLRFLLSKYLTRIEINFRTKVVYYVSNIYKNSPTWFVDSKVMNHDFIQEFDNHYNEDFKKNTVIKNHHLKYINDRYAPAWKTLEFFTFGTILKIYESLNDNSVKERISKCYNVYDVSKFLNFMKNLVILRNICAHGGVLYDYNFGKGFNKYQTISYNSRNTHTLDAACKVIAFILESISINRRNEFEAELKMLIDEYKSNQKIWNVIVSKSDF